MDAELDEWRAYHASPTDSGRNQLAERYLHLADRWATSIMRRLPPTHQIDDLVQDGRVGLMRAVELFDPDHGSEFQAFAMRHIVGAIYHGLRSQLWPSFSTRQRYRADGKLWQTMRPADLTDWRTEAVNGGIRASVAPDPTRRLTVADELERLQTGFSGRDRLLLMLYDGEELPMWQVGAVLGVGKTQVHRLYGGLQRILGERTRLTA